MPYIGGIICFANINSISVQFASTLSYSNLMHASCMVIEYALVCLIFLPMQKMCFFISPF